MNVFVPMKWGDYNSASQTVSDLSAIGAPTRQLWVALGIGYAILITGFGSGVWASARRNRYLRVVGALLLAYGVTSLVWPFAPMHLRGTEFTLTDTMHIVLALASVLLMLLAIGFAANAFGNWFWRYSVASIVMIVVFGTLTGLDASRISSNLPTPWVGVWERIDIGVFLLWVVALAIALWVRPEEQTVP